jgi:hypothetical protein
MIPLSGHRPLSGQGDFFMKKALHLFLLFVFGAAATGALAADIISLDRVSVLMPKSKVLSILGPPDETAQLGGGLNVDIYRVVNAMPLVRSGCIYYDKGSLVGQSFVFQGKMAGKTAERLREIGFSLLDEKTGSFRLAGRDDDTGQPLIAVIDENEGLTTVTTFEKGFYERWIK